jgi:hypothetical protein
VAETPTNASAEIASAKAEADRIRREAARERDHVKKLAARYARQAKHKLDAIRAHLEAQQSQLDEARGQFSAELVRFDHARQDFARQCQDELAKQKQAWAELESQRARLNASRTEMQQHAAKQDAALAARAAELGEREKHLGRLKSKLEAETASLRQEAAGLEARTTHARAVVEELEQKRDELRAEILATMAKPQPEPKGEYFVPLDRKADRDLAKWTADLDAQERRQTEEKAALAKLKAALEREAIAVADQRKVLAEQFALLGAARAEWQEQEGRTVAELEDLARTMRQREEDLAAREERLHLLAAGRREDAGELEQQRARLDEWQAKFIHVSQLWHSERERREAELTERARELSAREAALAASPFRFEEEQLPLAEEESADVLPFAFKRAA